MSILHFLIRSCLRDGKPRRSLAWLLLWSVSFALIGIIGHPSATTIGKPTDERYPCEDCPCGCTSAEFCWDRCCCHTDEEKLAWADRHGVTPPAFLVQRVGRSSQRLAADRSATGPDAGACCCCQHAGPDATPAVAPQPDSDKPDWGATESRSAHVVLMWKAAKCRGLAAFWSMLAVAFVNDWAGPWFHLVPLGWNRLGDQMASSRVESVDPPVPLRSLLS
ncbi:hypothetical protein [Crateriforma conspicua]|uniref:hypothetical protein n=1 Tax=Crateriforma conspicua TaxID=2527996 RepID=UPI0011B65D62|nr:hypothetical protein [Crateriforma conspicua]